MKVTLIRGDGIGPEVIESACRVLYAAGADIEWEEVVYKTPEDFEQMVASLRKNKVGLKGPITTPVGSGFSSINVALRKSLSLYAGVRPAKTIVEGRFTDVDIVVVRENTEGLYSGVEHRIGRDVAESIRIITRKACERIVRFAFEYAKKNSREMVTAVHKANILKCTCGLFLEVAKEVAEEYPEIEFSDKIVDNMCMQLVKKPQDYDVIVTTNLFGDIISDLCAGLVGGLGVAYGGNFGEEIALFEPVHGSCPKYAGKDIANPTAAILSAVMMLRYLGKKDPAERIERAVLSVLAKKEHTTQDLGGNGSLTCFTDQIVEEINRG